VLLYDWNIIGPSSEIFGNLQKVFGKCWETFVKPMEQFWKIFGNLRKIVKNLLLVCLYNKQNITCSLVDMNVIFECSTRYLTSERSSMYLLLSFEIFGGTRKSIQQTTMIFQRLQYATSFIWNMHFRDLIPKIWLCCQNKQNYHLARCCRLENVRFHVYCTL